MGNSFEDSENQNLTTNKFWAYVKAQFKLAYLRYIYLLILVTSKSLI